MFAFLRSADKQVLGLFRQSRRQEAQYRRRPTLGGTSLADLLLRLRFDITFRPALQRFSKKVFDR